MSVASERRAAVPSRAGDEPADARACLGPVLACRVNLLRQRRLSAEPARTALDAVLQAAQEQAKSSGAAQDALHEMIGGRSDREERRRLLDLRRRIHRGREIPDRLHEPPPGERWPAPVARRLAAERELTDARAHVREHSEDWLAQERETLAALLGDHDLAVALEMSAPLVAQAAERYRDHAGHWDAQDRKAERGLTQYVTRALVRTSPLGRFTAVGLTHWSAEGRGLSVAPDLAGRRAAVGYDRAMLVYALPGLLLGAGLPRAGWVELNATTEIAADELQFVVAAGGQVRRMALPRRPVTDALTALAGLGALPGKLLAEQLSAVFERPLADGEKAVKAALGTGLLTPAAAVDEQGDDILDEVAGRLSAATEAEAAQQMLAALRARLASIAEAERPGARRAALREIVELEAPLARATRRPARLQVNEDVGLAPAPVAASTHAAALEDLAAVVDLAALYDPMHELRSLLTRAAVELLGEGGERLLAGCAHELVATVYQRWAELDAANASRLGPADGSLAALLERRAAATAALLAGLDGEPGPGGPATAWDPQRLRELGAQLPDRFRRRPEAFAALVQPLDSQRVVLGALYSGHGTLFARFLGLDESLGGQARRRQAARLERRWGADGVPLAEDRGLHRLGVNEHVAILPRPLQAPDWVTLRLRHDPDRDELELFDGEGQPVRPMALGTAWQEALPPTVRIAAWLTASGRTPPDAIAEAWRRSHPGAGATAAIPALGTERVIVSRRRWLLGEDFPAIETGSDPGESLLALADWRAAHGVPAEVVVKSPLPERPDTTEEGLKQTLEERRREKPQYLDLSSALHARLLPRFLGRRGESFLEEALPALRDGEHALEWMIEFERGPGQRFEARVPPEADLT